MLIAVAGDDPEARGGGAGARYGEDHRVAMDGDVARVRWLQRRHTGSGGGEAAPGIIAIVVVAGGADATALAGDRIGEPRDHPDVGAVHGGVGEQRDARPVDQRVAPRPG